MDRPAHASVSQRKSLASHWQRRVGTVARMSGDQIEKPGEGADSSGENQLEHVEIDTATRSLQHAMAKMLQGSGDAMRKATNFVFLSLMMGLVPSPLQMADAVAEPPTVSMMSESAARASIASTDLLADASVATPAGRGYLTITGFPFPLGPFVEKKTVQTELVKDRVYGFEQEIKLATITANVRSTVFRMRDGHLLVYNPGAPTKEFLAQLDALNSKGVSHILLGATQYEHKFTVAPFARKFPAAKVWAVPDQWSWPIDLPAYYFGIDTHFSGGGDLLDTTPGSRAYSEAPDFTDEFEVKLLRPRKRLGFGYVANEAALYHKDTKTLALTDALIKVPSKAPALYDEKALIDIGDNDPNGATIANAIFQGTKLTNWQGTGAQVINEFLDGQTGEDTPEAQLQRGWERNALLSLLFGPDPSTIVKPDSTFARVADKWTVAPVTDALIYRSDRIKPELKRWIDDITKWDIEFISPTHFAAGPGSAADIQNAFKPTLEMNADGSFPQASEIFRPYEGKDTKLLDDLFSALVKVKIV